MILNYIYLYAIPSLHHGFRLTHIIFDTYIIFDKSIG